MRMKAGAYKLAAAILCASHSNSIKLLHACASHIGMIYSTGWACDSSFTVTYGSTEELRLLW